MYPGGHFIDAPYGSYQKAFNQTRNLLKQDDVIIYEAAFLYDGLFVMTDILIKKGNQIKLMKSRPNHLTLQKRTPLLVFVPIYEVVGVLPFDIAFQTYVASQCFPNFNFKSFFLMADQSKVAIIDGLNQMFRLPNDGDVRQDIEVRLSAEEAQSTSVLSEVEVSSIVTDIINDKWLLTGFSFSKAIQLFKNSYQNHIYSNWPTNYSSCKSCEFKIDEYTKNKGFKSDLSIVFQTASVRKVILIAQIYLIYGILEVKNY